MVDPTAVVSVTAFMLIGPILVLLNKYLLDSTNFAYPMFLSGLGLAFAGVVAHTAHALGYLRLSNEVEVRLYDLHFWIVKVLPVGTMQAATLATGNAQYLHSGVGIIQMLKAVTPLIVSIVAFVLLRERPSQRVVMTLIAISVGTAMTAGGDKTLTGMGLFLAMMSSLTEAVRLVLTQFLLQDLKFGVWEGQLFLAPAGVLCLGLAALFMEVPTIMAKGDFQIIADNKLAFLMAAALGLGVHIVTGYVIKATSSVTLKVLAQARNAGLIFCGVLMYNEHITGIQYLGYLITCIAFYYYTRYKMEDGAKPKEKDTKPPQTV